CATSTLASEGFDYW
nr:immunoglobulin heavy chain junction region [Macaca mulatta]MOY21128.1 immunoglobulin heavy chain junction region [Macaca mulatta]MOY21188.1 immunoglobulin heavy chain junction region [Macaca mulatta]MOY21335.1 immunoglobulin heavy chain junction region [Macaca mulatta]MOY21382.1 immunoglobulin heavy chain junction region [Macaca mulatta]